MVSDLISTCMCTHTYTSEKEREREGERERGGGRKREREKHSIIGYLMISSPRVVYHASFNYLIKTFYGCSVCSEIAISCGCVG